MQHSFEFQAWIQDPEGYYVTGRPVSPDDILEMARRIIDGRIFREASLCSPADTKAFLTLRLAERLSEAFCVVWLDNRHRVIAVDELFAGTIAGCSVHPREVVRSALAHNAAAVIFAHNHPSGAPEPSAADRQITRTLTDTLKLIDVRVLDHIVVGGAETVSFAERGLL